MVCESSGPGVVRWKRPPGGTQRDAAKQAHAHVVPLLMAAWTRLAALLLCAPVSAQFGNLEVKWQMDETSKDAVPSMGPPEPKGVLDGQNRATNLQGLSSEGLEGIVKSFGLSCATCTNAGHWISRVRSAGARGCNSWRDSWRDTDTLPAPSQSSRCSCASSSRTSKSAGSSATNACSASDTPCHKSSSLHASLPAESRRWSAAWLVARTPTHPPFTADTTRPCSPRNYVDELLDKCHLPVL